MPALHIKTLLAGGNARHPRTRLVETFQQNAHRVFWNPLAHATPRLLRPSGIVRDRALSSGGSGAGMRVRAAGEQHQGIRQARADSSLPKPALGSFAALAGGPVSSPPIMPLRPDGGSWVRCPVCKDLVKRFRIHMRIRHNRG
jgi:hypothetical protein